MVWDGKDGYVLLFGEERGTTEEQGPFEGPRPEAVDPQLKGQRALPRSVLQPREMPASRNRGTDTRDTTETSGADARRAPAPSVTVLPGPRRRLARPPSALEGGHEVEGHRVPSSKSLARGESASRIRANRPSVEWLLARPNESGPARRVVRDPGGRFGYRWTMP